MGTGRSRRDRIRSQPRISDRRASLRSDQEAVSSEIVTLGGTVVRRYWLANLIHTQIQAGRLEALLRHPAVQALAPTTTEAGPGDDGAQARSGTLTDIIHSYGYRGESNGRATTDDDNVKIGIVEAGGLNAFHVGWLDAPGGATRIARGYQCTSTACTESGAAFNHGGNAHGTRVTWAAGGSIDQGQDSTYPGSYTLAQARRGGASPEATIYYYRTPSGVLAYAVEQAVEDGVDILNFSAFNNCGCEGCLSTCNCSGLNQLMQNALSAGVLITACGGNNGDTNIYTCDAWYPGYRPETVAVNQLDTQSGTPYHNELVIGNAPSGPNPHRLVTSGTVHTSNAIDMLAPGRLEYSFGLGIQDYVSGSIAGCSYATPYVSGIAANLREAFSDIGWVGSTDARGLMVNLLLLGDASNGSATGQSPNFVHTQAGFGRIRAHLPTSANMTGPWGWGWRAATLTAGSELLVNVGTSGPESASVTTWKSALIWFDNDLEATSDVTIEVLNTCPSGGGPPVLVEYDNSYYLRKRVRLNQSQISGRCLQTRIRAWETPPGGTTIYHADYYVSGSTTVH